VHHNHHNLSLFEVVNFKVILMVHILHYLAIVSVFYAYLSNELLSVSSLLLQDYLP